MWKNHWLAGIVGLALLAACGDEHDHAEHGGKRAEGEDHGHASPHGGTVKTIGDYHAELVTGKEGALSLYILGLDEKSPHAIAAPSLTVQVQVKEQSVFTPVTLKASPLAGESGGKSSRFEGTLPEELHGKQLDMTIAISIDGKRHRAQFKTDADEHDADEHDEEEGEHKEHDD